MEERRILLAEAHLTRLLGATPQGQAWLPAAFTQAAQACLGVAGTCMLRLAVDVEAQRLHARWESLPPTPGPYRLRPLDHPLAWVDEGRLKGLDGPWSATVLAQAQALGAEDALLLWPDGGLAETAIAALVLVKGREALVPPLGGRVISLGESECLPPWARARGLSVRAAPLSLADLPGGELWCLNAVRGLWQVECLPDLRPMSP